MTPDSRLIFSTGRRGFTLRVLLECMGMTRKTMKSSSACWQGCPGPKEPAPNGQVWTTEGQCEGIIALAPRGQGGFGYDPLFYLPEQGLTMAELSEEVKNKISHRAVAMGKFRTYLTDHFPDKEVCHADSCGQ